MFIVGVTKQLGEEVRMKRFSQKRGPLWCLVLSRFLLNPQDRLDNSLGRAGRKSLGLCGSITQTQTQNKQE